MSWLLPHRLSTLHRAVSITLLYSAGLVALMPAAQAATIGKTLITSAQHQPLEASIAVSDIDAADFEANLASAAIYRQMGLTPTASMSIRFVPTSATTGQVLISTSEPVSTPFADVVLALNDGGKRKVMPKTLLMPLSNDVGTSVKQSNRVIAGAQKPNLPVVSNPIPEPLSVREGAPPPLINAPRTQASLSKLSAPNMPTSDTLPVVSASTATPLTMFQTSDMPEIVTNNSSMAASDTNLSNSANSTLTQDSSAQLSSSANNSAPDIQLDILSVQVKRQIQLKSELDNTTDRPPSPLIINANEMPADTAPPTQAQAAQQPADSALQPSITQPPTMQSPAPKPSTQLDNSANSYTVQRNDNLWIISQQIAQQNNIDVQTVMSQIKAQNPEAFIAQDADLLKADAKLSLPSYDVIPSQQNLQSAIAAQRQYYLQSNSGIVNKNNKKPAASKATDDTDDKQIVASKPIPAKTKPAATRPEEPTRTAIKTLPKAQFSVIAPGRDGSADGTQTKAAAATGNGLSTDILATLKSARQRTADQASRVATTNSALGQYTQRLQLQNQKLAELQARLKKLRNQ